MKSCSLVVFILCSAMATTGQAQEIPGTSDFVFGRLDTIGRDTCQLTYAVSVPMTRTEEYVVEVPIEVQNENGEIHTEMRPEQRTRETTLFETELRTREIQQSECQFQTIGGSRVATDQLDTYRGKPLVIFTGGPNLSEFHKQVFNRETLVVVLPPSGD